MAWCHRPSGAGLLYLHSLVWWRRQLGALPAAHRVVYHVGANFFNLLNWQYLMLLFAWESADAALLERVAAAPAGWGDAAGYNDSGDERDACRSDEEDEDEDDEDDHDDDDAVSDNDDDDASEEGDASEDDGTDESGDDGPFDDAGGDGVFGGAGIALKSVRRGRIASMTTTASRPPRHRRRRRRKGDDESCALLQVS